tara:strand:+ start:4238 stop:5143 length:906 start_codon:yes stop_codon:yes gene_type:complete
MSIVVNTTWKTEPEIFIGTIIDFKEIPNGLDLPVIEMIIENSFERYKVVMWQPHPDLQLKAIPDAAVQLVLWSGKPEHAVSRSDTVILLDTPDTLLHLPYSELRCPDIAVDIELFIAKCPVQPLTDFVRRVIGRPSVGIQFLNASMGEQGYQAPGSLAFHSFDVARRSFDACRGYSNEEKWIAAIAGLLHGLGRIELPEPATKGHLKLALKTLGLLSEDLKWLGKTHPEAARMIQFIIASMYRIGSHTDTHPAAMIVQTSHLVAAHLQSELMGSATRRLLGSALRPTTQGGNGQALLYNKD